MKRQKDSTRVSAVLEKSKFVRHERNVEITHSHTNNKDTKTKSFWPNWWKSIKIDSHHWQIIYRSVAWWFQLIRAFFLLLVLLLLLPLFLFYFVSVFVSVISIPIWNSKLPQFFLCQNGSAKVLSNQCIGMLSVCMKKMLPIVWRKEYGSRWCWKREPVSL